MHTSDQPPIHPALPATDFNSLITWPPLPSRSAIYFHPQWHFVSRDRFHANSLRGACLAAAVEKFAVGWLVGWQFNLLHTRVSSLEQISLPLSRNLQSTNLQHYVWWCSIIYISPCNKRVQMISILNPGRDLHPGLS